MSVLRRLGPALLPSLLAVVVALVISSAVMAALGVNPFDVFAVMLDFGDTPSQQVTAMVVIVNRAIPLFLAGLAVAVAFRMGLFNIGVEGQYRLATIVAAGAGAAIALPGPLHILVIVLVAMIVAAVWAGIVALLKVTRGVSEVISSIMMNFIALGIASYLLTGPLRGSAEGASIISTAEIPASGQMPGLNGIFGVLGLANPPRQLYSFLIVAVVVGVVIAVLLNRTRFGFDLKASGMSPSAASASGVDARAMVIKTMLLSGAVAGLIGLPDLLGNTHSYTTDFTAGLGFLGIAVSLLGRNRPLGIAFAALLFGFLDRALVPLQIADYPSSVVTIVQGTIVLAVVVANEISRRVTRRSAERGTGTPAVVVPGDGGTGVGQTFDSGGPETPVAGTGAGVSRTAGAGTGRQRRTGAPGMSSVVKEPGTRPSRGPITDLLTGGGPVRRAAWLALAALVLFSMVRAISGEEALTSASTISAALLLAVPIGLAGLGGLFSERAGVVNIGLEGMMILGTWGAGFAGYQWGWGAAIVGGVLFGALGGLLHALATVTFGVDHVVSGVAINILAAGVARFLSELFYTDNPAGGGVTQSPPVSSKPPTLSLPVLSSGSDLLGDLEQKHWFLLSDLAGILRGVTGGVAVVTVLAVLLIPATYLLLWRTAFGLRLRSCGENPAAADSLGVPVYRLKYIAVVISGALAGLGGVFLVFIAGIYREGQTNGRGFIGLASLIFGNWRPGGLAAGAGLFGFADALQLRSRTAVVALLLLVAILLAGVAIWQATRRKALQAVLAAAFAAVALLGYLTIDELPPGIVSFTPHLTTLLVLSLASQRLRMPKADGLVYRRGEH